MSLRRGKARHVVAGQGMAGRGKARPGAAWLGMAWRGKATNFNKGNIS